MSVSIAPSVAELTVRAGSIVAVAMFALLALGWRQHARAQTKTRRGSPTDRDDPATVGTGIIVDHVDSPEYFRPSAARRVVAALTGSAIAVVLGALIAIVISFGISFAVIELTRLLKG